MAVPNVTTLEGARKTERTTEEKVRKPRHLDIPYYYLAEFFEASKAEMRVLLYTWLRTGGWSDYHLYPQPTRITFDEWMHGRPTYSQDAGAHLCKQELASTRDALVAAGKLYEEWETPHVRGPRRYALIAPGTCIHQQEDGAWVVLLVTQDGPKPYLLPDAVLQNRTGSAAYITVLENRTELSYEIGQGCPRKQDKAVLENRTGKSRRAFPAKAPRAPITNYRDNILANQILTNRSIGDLSIRNDDLSLLEEEERTLVGGSKQHSSEKHEKGNTPRRSLGQAVNQNEQSKQAERQQTPAEAAAQRLLKDLLIEWGAEAPDIGSATVLAALAEAGAPAERLRDLIHEGAARVAEQREQPGAQIDNVAGYFIATMRCLAREARAKQWDIAQLRQADAKYRRRSGRSASPTLEEPTPCAPEEPTPPIAVEEETDEERAERLAAEEAERAWVEYLQPTVVDAEGREREVGMLWGFISGALAPELNTARRQCLRSLLPAADPDNRHLVLLTTAAYTARQAKNYLLHQLEAQREKLLASYFDAVEIVHVTSLPAWAKEQNADGSAAHVA